MTLFLIEGPAGGGKSQLAADMLESGELDVLSDVTALWATLSGAVRGPDGRYPVRQDGDPVLPLARYLQTVAVRFALQEGLNAGATTSRRGQAPRWQSIAEDAGAAFALRTVDPGIDTVRSWLADPDTGALSEECERAIGRWYG